MGHGRRDRSEADPFLDLEQARQLRQFRGQLLPAVVRLGTREDQDVPVVETAPDQLQFRPGQSPGHAVDDLEGRTPGPEVVDPVAVEGGQRVAILGQQRRGQRGGGPGVDPAVHGRDDDRGDEGSGGHQADKRHTA